MISTEKTSHKSPDKKGLIPTPSSCVSAWAPTRGIGCFLKEPQAERRISGFILIFFALTVLINVPIVKSVDSFENDQTTNDILSLQEILQDRQRFDKLPDFTQFEKSPDSTGYTPNEIIVKFKETTANLINEKFSRMRAGRVSGRSGSLDKLLQRYEVIKIEPLFEGFKARRAQLQRLAAKDRQQLTNKERQILGRLQRAPKKAEIPALDRIFKLKVQLQSGESLPEVVAAYNNDPEVEYAQLNYQYKLVGTPNDPQFSLQWALENYGQEHPPAYDSGGWDSDIDAPEAWDITTGDSEMVVAVIDTGVDYNHRDIDDNMWTNEDEHQGDYNYDGFAGVGGVDDDGDGLIDEDSLGNSRFLDDGVTPNPLWKNDIPADDDENGYEDDFLGYDFCKYDDNQWDSDPLDDHGHGTHCAGIIAAEGNNGLDIAGINWNAKIMAVKFLSYNGSGSSSDAIKAIEYAVDNGAQVLSNSWGRRGDDVGADPAMQDAIAYAASLGVTVVAAAGNDNNDNSSIPYFPANYEQVISVAATDSHDERASFSNFGDMVDIAAPGVDIISLRAGDTSMGAIYNDYTTVASGTSMAGPHVAGAAAFLLAYDNTLIPRQISYILTTTGDPLEPGICRSNARLNLFNAL
ncbi:S8 family peptidase, partial [Planctomycetota bacterium]